MGRQIRAEPTRTNKSVSGGAKPRLTSGGKAEMKVLLKKSENLAYKGPRFLRAVQFTVLRLQPASALVAESQRLS